MEHGIVDEVRWNDERPVSPTRSAIESIATRYAGILVVDVDQELVIATRIVHHANDDEVRIGNDARDIEFRIAPLEGQVKPLPTQYPISTAWDFIKVWSAEMPQVFRVDDIEWLLMGELNITKSTAYRAVRVPWGVFVGTISRARRGFD